MVDQQMADLPDLSSNNDLLRTSASSDHHDWTMSNDAASSGYDSKFSHATHSLELLLYTVEPVLSGHPRGMAKRPLNTGDHSIGVKITVSNWGLSDLLFFYSKGSLEENLVKEIDPSEGPYQVR